MVIGLYDIDLWHGSRAYPNLELMQIYNYLYHRGDKVLLTKPNDEIGRFNKIIYFNDHSKIPKNIEVVGEKKQTIGYAFYHINEPLKEEISSLAPSFLPYDPWTERLSNKSSYEKMKRSSYIRLETNNLGGFKTDASTIFFADNNLFDAAAAINFIEKYKSKYNFCCIHSPQIKTEEMAQQVARYTNIFDKPFICKFDFSSEFFYNYYDSFVFTYKRHDEEPLEEYIERVLKMALWLKSKRKNTWIEDIEKSTPLLKYISNWVRCSPPDLSYQDYYSNNKEAYNEIFRAATPIRLLLKISPLSVTRKTLN